MARTALPKTPSKSALKQKPQGGKPAAAKAPGAKSLAKKTPAKKPLTYAAAGVDIDAGDEVVDRIKPIVRRTYSPRVLGLHGAFAGMFRLNGAGRKYKDPVLVGCTDGVGTKVLLAAEFKIYDTVGIDCVAMNVNDLIVQGAEPLFFLDYLGLSKLDTTNTTAMIAGVAKGCEIAGCALIGGECAEMPDIYSPGDFDVAGFCVGVIEHERIKRQPKVKVGDVVIGLRSSGVHSNGYTLVRRIVKDARLSYTRKYAELGGRRLIDVLLEPTRIYAKQVIGLLDMLGKKRGLVSGMAHITGGGLLENIPRVLPEGLAAHLRQGSWPQTELFAWLQRTAQIDDIEMNRTFNNGIGMVVVIAAEQAEACAATLRSLGETVYTIGAIAPQGSGAQVVVG